MDAIHFVLLFTVFMLYVEDTKMCVIDEYTTLEIGTRKFIPKLSMSWSDSYFGITFSIMELNFTALSYKIGTQALRDFWYFINFTNDSFDEDTTNLIQIGFGRNLSFGLGITFNNLYKETSNEAR